MLPADLGTMAARIRIETAQLKKDEQAAAQILKSAEAKTRQWEERVGDLKIAAISNVSRRSIAEINQRYARELQAAKGNAAAISQIRQAQGYELEAAAKRNLAVQRQAQLTQATEARRLTQRVQDLRISGMTNVSRRAAAEISMRYARELKAARGNAAAILQIRRAQGLEMEAAAKAAHVRQLQRMRDVQTKMKSAGVRAIITGAIIAVPIIKATKVFADFDDQMRITQAVTQATTKDLKDMSDQAKFLGRTTSFTASQVAGSMVELGRAGFAVQELQAAVPHVLNLARATGTDLSTAAGIASSTLRSFNLEAKETQRIADVMTAAANNSAQTLEDLGESMKYAAPVAAEFNMSLEQTAKALSTMANFSIRGSMAGTSLRMMLLRLSDPAVRKKLDDIGISITKWEGGPLRDVSDILQELGRNLKKLPKADALGFMGDLFGARAVAGGLKIASTQFEKLNDAIDNAEGTAARTAKTMDKGIGGALRMLWSAVEGTTIAIGEGLAPSLSSVAEKIISMLGPVTEWIERNRGAVVVVAALAAILITVGTGLLTVSAGLWLYTTAAGAAAAATGALTAAIAILSAHPIVAVFVALAAVLVGVIALVVDLTDKTTKLTDTMTKYAERGKIILTEDEKRIARLIELSELEAKNGKEMAETAGILETLTNKYGDHGIVLDEATGGVYRLATGYEILQKRMKGVRVAQVDAAIAEKRKVISDLNEEIEKESGRLWSRIWTSDSAADLSKKLDAQQAQLKPLLLEWQILQGDDGSVEKLKTVTDQLRAKKIQEEIKASEKIAEEALKWEDKLEEIRIQGIEDETERRIQEIQLRYDKEFRTAADNEAIRASMIIAEEKEIAQVVAGIKAKAREEETKEAERAATKLADDAKRKAENYAQAVTNWEQKLGEIKIRGIKDEAKRRLAEIDFRYKHEMMKAKTNWKLIRVLAQAQVAEREIAIREIAEKEMVEKRKSGVDDAPLPSLIERGTAEALSAVLRQEQDTGKQTAKNTGQMVREQRRTNELLERERDDAAILNLGLAG